MAQVARSGDQNPLQNQRGFAEIGFDQTAVIVPMEMLASFFTLARHHHEAGEQDPHHEDIAWTGLALVHDHVRVLTLGLGNVAKDHDLVHARGHNLHPKPTISTECTLTVSLKYPQIP